LTREVKNNLSKGTEFTAPNQGETTGRRGETACQSCDSQAGRQSGGGDRSGRAGSLPEEASQGREGVEDISQEDQGFGAEQAEDRQAFETPGFEGGIATFDGIAGAVIEGFPGGTAEGNVANQAGGTIGEALTDVNNPSMDMLVGLIGAIWRGIGDLIELNMGLPALETGFVTAPFMALAIPVKAIGSQAVAIVADGSALIVIPAGDPLLLILIGGMAAAVNDPAGLKASIHGVEVSCIP
jgi:hypothetical protein